MPSLKKPVRSENRHKTDEQKRAAPKTAFPKGVSGNPGGRPKKTEEAFALESACKDLAPKALGVMVNLMHSAKQDGVRLQAALAIIERAHGKPVQRSEVRTGELDGLPHDELKQVRDALLALANDAAPGSPVAGRAGSTTH